MYIHSNSVEGTTMKTRKVFSLALVSMLLIFVGVGTVMAETDDNVEKTTSNDGESFLDAQVNNMNPAIQPYARVVADNLVLCFNFIGAAAILGFGLWGVIEKRRGHTQQAAEAKHSATDVVIGLIWALVLFNIFVALCKSSTFGI